MNKLNPGDIVKHIWSETSIGIIVDVPIISTQYEWEYDKDAVTIFWFDDFGYNKLNKYNIFHIIKVNV